MWPSVFLHEFLDSRIRNYLSVPGNLVTSPAGLNPAVDPVTGINAVEIKPGTRLEFEPVIPPERVIGFSCAIRFLPREGISPSRSVPIVNLDGAAEFHLWSEEDPELEEGVEIVSRVADLRVNSQPLRLGTLQLPRVFTDLRFDWHNSGQARLLMDGKLVAYHNAVAPGAFLNINKIIVGLPDPTTDPPPEAPSYAIARILVRALRHKDSLATFTRMLPEIKPAEADMHECVERTFDTLAAMLARLRKFMSEFHQTQSQPWSASSNPQGGPFSERAIRAHQLAVASMVALSRILHTGDLSARDTFLDPFTDFLREVRDAQPNKFNALLAELQTINVVPEECRELFKKTLDQNKRPVIQIAGLLAEAANRLRTVAGGH